MKNSQYLKVIPSLILFSLFSNTAFSEVRAMKLCSKQVNQILPVCVGNPMPGSYITCRVGVRGDWLDITSKVTHISGPRAANVSINYKSVAKVVPVPFGTLAVCDPGTTKAREGFVELDLGSITGTGNMLLRLDRPGGSDTVSIPIINGGIGLSPRTYSVPLNQEVILDVYGRNLQTLRARPQAAIDANFARPGNVVQILEIRDDFNSGAIQSQKARVRLQLTDFRNSASSIDLTNLIHFPQGVTEFNQIFGQPTISFRVPTSNTGTSQLPSSPILIGSCRPTAANPCPGASGDSGVVIFPR